MDTELEIRIADFGGNLYINRIDTIDWVQSGVLTFPKGIPSEVLRWIGIELTAFGEPNVEIEKDTINTGYIQFDMDDEIMQIHCAVDPENGVYYKITSFFDFLYEFRNHCHANIRKHIPTHLHEELSEVIHNSVFSLIVAITDIVKETTHYKFDWSPNEK